MYFPVSFSFLYEEKTIYNSICVLIVIFAHLTLDEAVLQLFLLEAAISSASLCKDDQ